MITMRGIEVQKAKEVGKKNKDKTTKGRKKFEARQLNQSLENRRDDEKFNGNFKCSQLNQFLELNQSMENRGDENFAQIAQPVHGEKMQRRNDENFNENFKRSQLNLSLENRRRSANFNGRLNQSMENRGDDNETQPVHGEKMQRPRGVIHIYFSLFNE